MSDFTKLVDLAAERLGGAVPLANDEFFAPREALLRAAAPEWREGEYTDRGKWMDGWETRRRRTPGHDWCIVRLGLPGVIHGVLVDTAFFTGNYPEQCSIDATAVDGVADPEALAADEGAWTEILPPTALRGDAQNLFGVESRERFTHLRFRIYPDGGVARLRVYGQAAPDWDRLLRAGGAVDLGALENGGSVVASSNAHYGNPQNMLQPGRSTHMGDGWETCRRRGPGHDWSIIRLGRPGVLNRVELDTDHFKGNAPGSCWLEGVHAPDAGEEELQADGVRWTPILAQTPLRAHERHAWEAEVMPHGAVTHVRISIHPDGGVARLRLLGRPDDAEPPA
ncbi:MAG TPA: allantoicase [Longimicrobiaceae bacterium]|nr:allantoicase [Longimicrobiaceae bacterium]